MSEPLGLLSANDPKYRDLPIRAEHSPSGTASGPIAVRPFAGFERESSTYASLRPRLLAKAHGQFVVLVGDDFEGPFPTFGDAERAGYRRFGLGPLYIKQVLTEERAQEVSRDVDSCRP